MAARKPAVAGRFYPARPKPLREMVAAFMNDSGVDPAPEKVAAIVAPHAGYEYSGPTAGYVYAQVRGKQPRRVIVVGCSHRYAIHTASVYSEGAFETPLGAFPIDEPFAADLARKLDSESADPHLHEHSLEVQLPFLAVAIGEILPIVPILFGAPAHAWHADVGAKLAERVDETDLVVASTDLSHFSNEEPANQIDNHTLDVILSQDTEALEAGLRDGSCSMCGGAAVVMAMGYALARGATDWSRLDYRTSGQVTGDYDRVVGYGAVSMEFPS